MAETSDQRSSMDSLKGNLSLKKKRKKKTKKNKKTFTFGQKKIINNVNINIRKKYEIFYDFTYLRCSSSMIKAYDHYWGSWGTPERLILRQNEALLTR